MAAYDGSRRGIDQQKSRFDELDESRWPDRQRFEALAAEFVRILRAPLSNTTQRCQMGSGICVGDGTIPSVCSSHLFSNQECDFHGLFVVQPRIYLAAIVFRQVSFREISRATRAFSNVFAGEFQMNPAQT
jgi:hypothetical protein